jgi:hypothetical protein
VIFLRQTLLGEKYFPILQCCIVLQVPLTLASRPGWLVLFLLVLVEGDIQLYQLVGGVRLAHLPTLVLPMAGTQWRLRDWTKGHAIPLRVRLQFYHIFLPAWLLISLLFPVKHHSRFLS